MKTGYIGLGNMGKPIATNALRGGFDLMVYDVREEPMRELEALGAKTAGAPREIARHAEIVEISVVDDAQVEEVVLAPDGLLTDTQPGMIIAIHSTIHPRTPQVLALAAEPRGVRIVDAALSGGSTGAAAGTLCYMVGGEAADVEKCRPLFSTSGAQIIHVGGVGLGAATKLAQQVIICLNRLAAHEGMRLAERAGVDIQAFQEVVRVTNARNAFAEQWEQQRQIAGTDSTMPEGMAHLFWKGLVPALELGHELGLSMPATALVQQLFPQVLGLKE
ncbi:MAG: NAD-binding protein [Chloroflexi bacterium]|nr:NAD-binding protein [Chloroflexota bacterium]